MTLYDLPAPAKLNLFLHVVGQRADGYHLLESLFRLVSLSDTLTIDLRADGRISRESSMATVLDEADDLAVRAAQALKNATGSRQGAHIVVYKRIPVGGGLGGGSSDAATVLIALNRLWRTGLTRSELMALALPLGADVPFFLSGQAAFVTGIGEQCTPVEAPDSAYVIFKPRESVSTAAIFGSPHLTRNTETVKISDFSGRHQFLGKKPFGVNDLESVVLQAFPSIALMRGWLKSQGFDVRLTGSGACFFSEFEGPIQALLAYEALQAKLKSRASGTCEQDVLQSAYVCDGLLSHPLQHWLVD